MTNQISENEIKEFFKELEEKEKTMTNEEKKEFLDKIKDAVREAREKLSGLKNNSK